MNFFVTVESLPVVVPYGEGMQLFSDVVARENGVVDIVERVLPITGGATEVETAVTERDPIAASAPLPGEGMEVEERWCRKNCL
ncbi:hypothetical protein SCLCIDRAFT_1223383 [Scleroderma citrinum Foug A]|uniref:Uncharacterized protein n=1 Tax=Scleroderma citrinum Foug A TaxID=1036808 RepID=A0A0C3CWC9_9AGAM|nr:hypothetical protein SCLCIDRAFT_1223383 [Scleroderma citrinum Foug A]